MRRRQWMCVIFVLSLFLVHSPIQASTTFYDVGEDFWGKAEIELLTNRSIVGGYPDGSFKPNQTVTRAQAATMIVQALGLSVEERPNPGFTDISKGFYAYDYIAAVADEGIINGKQGRFLPNQPLTRGQMAAILDRAFKLAPSKFDKLFRDINDSYLFYGSIQRLADNRITTGYSDGTYRPNEPTTRAQFSVFLARVLEERFKPNVTEQIIVVVASSLTSQTATVRTYERVNGKVNEALPVMNAVLGYNGMGRNKSEGDGQTPIGSFHLSKAFGTAPAPTGVRLPYQQTTKADYWIDDPSSPDYNKWVTYKGDPTKKWKSFERLAISQYKYAVVIDYNTDPIVPGKGSAIFLHVWRDYNRPTAGCIALAETDVIKLLKWLNPQKSPVIMIGLEKDVPQF
ncbi:S-layer homology domain-containing protein [Bacillus solitudinis]|uniref:S-layer homology domain-containing protein n=1 Tax=Bacillus solitudinis TaxID=2014074 RepID=UPI001D0CF19A|nr:S-layer homology domain-containing protein [Bacillus solitudinis]